MYNIIYFSLNFHLLVYFFKKISEPILKTLDNSADIFNALSNIPGNISNITELFQVTKK